MSKRSKTAQLAKTSRQKQKVCTGGRVLINEKFDVVTYLSHTTIFVSFWGIIGSNWGQERSKITHRAENNPKCSIFVLVFDIFLRETQWCH